MRHRITIVLETTSHSWPRVQELQEEAILAAHAAARAADTGKGNQWSQKSFSVTFNAQGDP